MQFAPRPGARSSRKASTITLSPLLALLEIVFKLIDHGVENARVVLRALHLLGDGRGGVGVAEQVG